MSFLQLNFLSPKIVAVSAERSLPDILGDLIQMLRNQTFPGSISLREVQISFLQLIGSSKPDTVFDALLGGASDPEVIRQLVLSSLNGNGRVVMDVLAQLLEEVNIQSTDPRSTFALNPHHFSTKAKWNLDDTQKESVAKALTVVVTLPKPQRGVFIHQFVSGAGGYENQCGAEEIRAVVKAVDSVLFGQLAEDRDDIETQFECWLRQTLEGYIQKSLQSALSNQSESFRKNAYLRASFLNGGTITDESEHATQLTMEKLTDYFNNSFTNLAHTAPNLYAHVYRMYANEAQRELAEHTEYQYCGGNYFFALPDTWWKILAVDRSIAYITGSATSVPVSRDYVTNQLLKYCQDKESFRIIIDLIDPSSVSFFELTDRQLNAYLKKTLMIFPLDSVGLKELRETLDFCNNPHSAEHKILEKFGQVKIEVRAASIFLLGDFLVNSGRLSARHLESTITPILRRKPELFSERVIHKLESWKFVSSDFQGLVLSRKAAIVSRKATTVSKKATTVSRKATAIPTIVVTKKLARAEIASRKKREESEAAETLKQARKKSEEARKAMKESQRKAEEAITLKQARKKSEEARKAMKESQRKAIEAIKKSQRKAEEAMAAYIKALEEARKKRLSSK